MNLKQMISLILLVVITACKDDVPTSASSSSSSASSSSNAQIVLADYMDLSDNYKSLSRTGSNMLVKIDGLNASLTIDGILQTVNHYNSSGATISAYSLYNGVYYTYTYEIPIKLFDDISIENKSYSLGTMATVTDIDNRYVATVQFSWNGSISKTTSPFAPGKDCIAVVVNTQQTGNGQFYNSGSSTTVRCKGYGIVSMASSGIQYSIK